MYQLSIFFFLTFKWVCLLKLTAFPAFQSKDLWPWRKCEYHPAPRPLPVSPFHSAARYAGRHYTKLLATTNPEIRQFYYTRFVKPSVPGLYELMCRTVDIENKDFCAQAVNSKCRDICSFKWIINPTPTALQWRWLPHFLSQSTFDSLIIFATTRRHLE